jgi:hypothetical protein
MDVEECEGGLAESEKRYREKLQSLRGRHEREVQALEKEHALKVREYRPVLPCPVLPCPVLSSPVLSTGLKEDTSGGTAAVLV